MQKIEIIRHSLAHILASAIQQLYPKTKFGIGPVIENGFYYDFDFKEDFSDKDLLRLEKKMAELLKQNIGFKKKNVSKIQAKKTFKNQPYKLELISELPPKEITIYESGNFVDLCRGPHVKNTKEIPSDGFKLTKIAGAYWRGSEKNKMLTRIYGVAFEAKKQLNNYFQILEEAEKRDHRKLGEKLEIFLMHETAPGMPYFLPKGVIIYNELVKFWRQEHQKRGYQEFMAPLFGKKELYQISGHWEHYQENMFVVETKEKETYGIKAMNCPNAMLIFKSRPRSYKELPLRLSDVDFLHRYELSGTLYGLLRTRCFHQDDAHIFVDETQIKREYENILSIVKRFYSVFNLEYSFRLGTKPKTFMGDLKTWNKAEKALKEILEENNESYIVLPGDGAFYGPKIDILIKDSLGREWQMGTIQLDFQMPKNFNLSYVDEKGKKKTPVAIHRVIYGSLERFIGILIEQYSGAFPLWLSPVQVCVIPVGTQHRQYADSVQKELFDSEIRAETKCEAETVSKKIREGEMQKIPYILVVGDKERKAKSVRIRAKNKDLGEMKLSKFLEKVKKEIEQKK